MHELDHIANTHGHAVLKLQALFHVRQLDALCKTHLILTRARNTRHEIDLPSAVVLVKCLFNELFFSLSSLRFFHASKDRFHLFGDVTVGLGFLVAFREAVCLCSVLDFTQ